MADSLKEPRRMMLMGLLTLSVLWPVTTGDVEVSCVPMESCILPCSFEGSDKAVVHWRFGNETGMKTKVHSYYGGKDQLGGQDEHFRGRTVMFRDQISRGNASLLLERVEVQDQGRYWCYSSITRIGYNKSAIILKVDAPVGEVDIQQEGNTTGQEPPADEETPGSEGGGSEGGGSEGGGSEGGGSEGGGSEGGRSEGGGSEGGGSEGGGSEGGRSEGGGSEGGGSEGGGSEGGGSEGGRSEGGGSEGGGSEGGGSEGGGSEGGGSKVVVISAVVISVVVGIVAAVAAFCFYKRRNCGCQRQTDAPVNLQELNRLRE